MENDVRILLEQELPAFPKEDEAAAAENLIKRQFALMEIHDILLEAREGLAEMISSAIHQHLPEDATVSAYIAHHEDGEPPVSALLSSILEEQNSRKICIPRFAPERNGSVAFDLVQPGYQDHLQTNQLGVQEITAGKTIEMPAKSISHILVPSPLYSEEGLVTPRNTGYFGLYREMKQLRTSVEFWALAYLPARLSETSIHEYMDAVFTPAGKISLKPIESTHAQSRRKKDTAARD